MKPSEKLRAEGVTLSDRTAAILDRGWEDYDPAVDDVDVVEMYDDRDIEYKSWEGAMVLWDEGRIVQDADDLELWFTRVPVTPDEFLFMAVYRSHVDRPGFEWLKAWGEAQS